MFATCIANYFAPISLQVTGFRKPTLPIGAPCLNDTGFCDIFHVCQVVDLQTPIDNIKGLYYKREGKYMYNILRVFSLEKRVFIYCFGVYV